MRYYNLKLNTNADEIKNNSKLENYGYSYQNPVAAVNSYMYQNMKNDFTFLAYREEENFVSATFSYNEKRLRLQDAYDYIMEMLGKAFCIKKIKENPYEITMCEYLENFLEARRRAYLDYGGNRLPEIANIWIYNYFSDLKALHYDFKEKIISRDKK